MVFVNLASNLSFMVDNGETANMTRTVEMNVSVKLYKSKFRIEKYKV